MSDLSIFAIDPGTTHSGWCWFTNGIVCDSGFEANDEILEKLSLWAQPPNMVKTLAIEMIASYGMPVGREVFETCVWIGRFVQAWRSPSEALLVYRKDVKQYLCGSVKAKDGNVRQALIDLIGPVGTKKAQGPLYGVSGHVWPALAVAATVAKVKRSHTPVAGVEPFWAAA